ncbi:MAG: helix-turn-helix transcriptional regulator [Candidatus Poribacteria bacterium]|nr:helix-turn-helix transcriptional regulator [Candidatus Poribacteria bacterium]
MDAKKIEKQLLDFAEKLGGEEFVEELMETKPTNPTPKQSTSKTTLFDPDRFRLDSELIRVRLKECKLTIKQLHEKVGVSYRTIMRWLTNDEFPKDKNLMQLAEVLQLEPHQLLVSSNAFRQKDTLNENIRFAQRSIESIITEILDDEKMPKDKKVDALIKYHNALIKLKSS